MPIVGKILVTIIAAGTVSATAQAAVPAKFQGVWGLNGRCDLPAKRLTITRNKARWGKEPFSGIDYDPQDQALHWDEDGTVDNFGMGAGPNLLVHRTQGFNMPGHEAYARCGKGMKRVRLPAH